MNRNFEEMAYHLTGGASLVNHRHQNPDSFEVIQIIRGEGTAFLLDRTYPLSEGMLLFIDAASLHCITPLDVNNYCRNKLIVDKQYLSRVFEAVQANEMIERIFGPHAGSCFYLTSSQAEQVDRLFQKMESEFVDESAERNMNVVAALMNIFSLCCRSTEKVPPLTDDKLSPVMQYLRLHYAETISIDRIAEEMHMSKFYLCHLFRRQTGLTLMQYLLEQRLAAARCQMAFSNCSISEIAQNCGFGSSSHFCTLFRRIEGLSPREYRQKTRH